MLNVPKLILKNICILKKIYIHIHTHAQNTYMHNKLTLMLGT